MEIIKVLQDIQSKLIAPKNQFNAFGNYKYRNCEDILEALKPLLKVHEASVVIEDEVVTVGDRFYVKATATIYKNDGFLSAKAFAREPLDRKGMDASQITGATSSYARKYALNGLFAIDDSKDPDSTNTHDTATTQKVSVPAPVKAYTPPNAPQTATNAPTSHENVLDIEGVLLEANTRTQKRKADGKEFTITDYKIQSKSHGDVTISCFGSAVEAETWSTLLFIDVKEREFKGKKELSASKVVVKEATTVNADAINWEE